jgi:hypothetical protein
LLLLPRAAAAVADASQVADKRQQIEQQIMICCWVRACR